MRKITKEEIQKLRDENEELETKLDKAVEVLKSIEDTDISDCAPNLRWLQEWRHNTKNKARAVLKEIEG